MHLCGHANRQTDVLADHGHPIRIDGRAIAGRADPRRR